jgi:hypothetical protein
MGLVYHSQLNARNWSHPSTYARNDMLVGLRRSLAGFLVFEIDLVVLLTFDGGRLWEKESVCSSVRADKSRSSDDSKVLYN